jgi:hypothetical protein
LGSSCAALSLKLTIFTAGRTKALQAFYLKFQRSALNSSSSITNPTYVGQQLIIEIDPIWLEINQKLNFFQCFFFCFL